jgi:hypothetical protein
VKPAGNVAALREKNPPPRKSQATRLTQGQTRRDKFWLFDRLLFSTGPDFENFVGLARIVHPFCPCIVPLSILPADSTPIKNDLPKLKDFPAEICGSGQTMPE